MSFHVTNTRASLAVVLSLAWMVWTPQAGSHAQTRAAQDCHHIEVASPFDVVDSGAPITFHVSISGGDPAVQYTFRWTVSAGTITGGQDTSEITVDTTGLGGQNVLATAEVRGGPEPCTNSDSATVAVRAATMCCESIDQYGAISFRNEQARLDNFAIALQSEAGAKGYIMAYDGRRARAGEARRRANRAKRYLVNTRGLEAERIIIIDSGHREEMNFVLYILPEGAAPPAPTPTVDPSEVQTIREGRRRMRRRGGE
jgi:hypothetical protein